MAPNIEPTLRDSAPPPAGPGVSEPPSENASERAGRVSTASRSWREAGESFAGSLSASEWRAMGALCGVYALRSLGLYMVLPVLSLYARGLEGSTSFLTGLSIGAYGFTNMLLVLPFGILSDTIGRRKVIAIGLAAFALGSFVAAWAPDIHWLLAGRALQGMGAVSSVVVALVGDVTRPQVRGRAMALLGVSVALAFAAGVIGGPLLAGEFGVASLFVLTGVLSLLALGVVLLAVPSPERIVHYEEYEPRVAELRAVLLQPTLVKLDCGMFVIHLALTAMFVVIPILIDPLLPTYHLWRVYAPIIVVAMGIMLATMTLAEKTHAVHKVLYAGIALFGTAFLVLRLFSHSLGGIVAGLALFVIAFGLLEPTLTALLTRYTTRESRGTAAGVFNMSGFFGAFVGGAMGGLLLGSHGDLFLALVGVALLWLIAALRIRQVEVMRLGRNV